MTMYPKRGDDVVRGLFASERPGMKAEAAVYDSLEKVFGHDADVSCLWSLKPPETQRELDFLVVDRERGFAVIEVKSYPLIPVDRGWMKYDPATGDRWPDHRSEPADSQLGAASSAIKRWWKMAAGNPQVKNPRGIQIVVLAGTPSRDLPKDSGVAFCEQMWRQRAGCFIVCQDEIEHLPHLIRNRLESTNPRLVADATDAFWEAHFSLVGSTGCMPSESAEEEDRPNGDAGGEADKKPDSGWSLLKVGGHVAAGLALVGLGFLFGRRA